MRCIICLKCIVNPGLRVHNMKMIEGPERYQYPTKGLVRLMCVIFCLFWGRFIENVGETLITSYCLQSVVFPRRKRSMERVVGAESS